MQTKKYFHIMALLVTLSMLFSCTAGVDSLTADFNAGFSTAHTDTTGANSAVSESTADASIYDDDFSASTMLSTSYVIHAYTTLCIKAPDEAESYTWTATAVSGSGYSSDKTTAYTLSTEQQLNLCPAKTQLQTWTEYSLELTVQSYEGNVYTDTATLVVIPN